jgi:hypothetical protein
MKRVMSTTALAIALVFIVHGVYDGPGCSPTVMGSA